MQGLRHLRVELLVVQTCDYFFQSNILFFLDNKDLNSFVAKLKTKQYKTSSDTKMIAGKISCASGFALMSDFGGKQMQSE